MIQNETLKPHLSWFNEIKDKYNDINKNNIDKSIVSIKPSMQISHLF